MPNETLYQAIRCVHEKGCWVTAFALAGLLTTARSIVRGYRKRKTKSRRSGRFPVRFTLHTGQIK
jgi:hypothetical protein